MQCAVISLADHFSVDAPCPAVWCSMTDTASVVTCIPGARITGRRRDGAFEGELSVKLGPTAVRFLGTATPQFDPAHLEGSLVAGGADRSGRTRAQARTTFSVEPDDRGSTVHLSMRIEVLGPLASFARTGGAVLGRRMMAEFAQRLAAFCGERPEDP